MCFFDKSNNSMIVVAFKQRLNGRDHEKLFTGIAKMGALRSALRWVEVHKKHKMVGRHRK